MEFISADIGNSRIKILIGNNLLAFNLDEDFYDKLLDLIDDKEFIYSSVNIKAEEMLLKKLIENSVKFRKITEDEIKKVFNLEAVQGMGLDRALGFAGALSITEPPLITIDCGSALTVNILDENRNALGGIIMPGLVTQLESLKRLNPILYPTNMDTPKEVIPVNTNDAVLAGILNALLGGVTKFLFDVFDELEWSKNQIPIFVTGGYRELIAEELINKVFDVYIHENLVTYGIRNIVEIGSR